jgi:hypothetical protein
VLPLYEYDYEPPERQEIDERWFQEYVDWGYAEVVEKLKKHAAFLDYLADKEREAE